MGNPAKAQLARAVRSPEEAFNLMKGAFFIVETKFDGGHAIALALTPALSFSSCTHLYKLLGTHSIVKQLHHHVEGAPH